MAAAKGNKYATKQQRIITDTLRRVAVQNPAKVRKACEECLDKAANGDLQAFREMADRLDGRAIQSTEITVTDRTADRISDDELANIATGSSTGASEQAESETPLH